MAWECLGQLREQVSFLVLAGGLFSIVKVLVLSIVVSNIVKSAKGMIPIYLGAAAFPAVLLFLYRGDFSQIAEEQATYGLRTDILRTIGSELGDCNEVSCFSSYGLISAVGLFLMWKRNPLRWVALLSIFPTLTLMGYLGSRTGMLSIPVLAFFFWFFYIRDVSRGRPAVKLAGVILLSAMLLGAIIWVTTAPFFLRFSQPEGGLGQGRVHLALQGLKMFADSPIIGHGPFGFMRLAAQYGASQHVAHNTFVEMLVRGGLPGFLIYYAAWFLIIRELWRLRRLCPTRRDLIVVDMGLLFCVSLQFYSLSLTMVNPRLVWFMIGGCIGYAYSLRERIASMEPMEPIEGDLDTPVQWEPAYGRGY
jgi:hypothetical protein